MSKTSPKKKYIQLTEWLGQRKQATVKTSKPERESRLGYYNKKGNKQV